jgi:hypothetical protein
LIISGNSNHLFIFVVCFIQSNVETSYLLSQAKNFCRIFGKFHKNKNFVDFFEEFLEESTKKNSTKIRFDENKNFDEFFVEILVEISKKEFVKIY